MFQAFVEQVLCPRLRPGQVVVMDNLSAHKVAAANARAWFQHCGYTKWQNILMERRFRTR